jgi:hypothetical protein
MISVDAAVRGLACDCVCPECKGALVAAKGDILRHHFRHLADFSLCAHARETALHLFAKQIICERLELGYPKWHRGFQDKSFPVDLGRLLSVHAEVELDGGMRADILAKFEHETVAVEIFVAHRVDAEKIKKLDANKIAAIEIDLSAYRHADKGDAEWQEAVLHRAHRYWLYPPASVRNAEDALRQEWLEQQRRKQEIALAIQREFEEERLRRQREQEEFETRITEEMQQREEQRRHLSAIAKAQANEREVIAIRERENQYYREQIQRLFAEARAREIEATRKTEIELIRVKLAEERIKYADLSHALRKQSERERSPPDLSLLVEAHDGYDKIPTDAWNTYDAALATWQHRLRTENRPTQSTGMDDTPLRFFPFYSDIPSTELCLICDQIAHFGYCHDDEMRWFCADHRLAVWWADARK